MKTREEIIKDQIINKWCSDSRGIYFDNFSRIYAQIFARYKFDVDYIEQHSEFIDWYALSRNENISWTLDFISKHKDDFDWCELSCNKGIKFTVKILREFSDKWDFISLMENNLIKPNKNILIKYRKNIGRKIMCLYQPYDFEDNNEHLIKYPFLLDFEVLDSFSSYPTEDNHYENYLDWEKLSQIRQLINNRDFLLRYRKYLYWDKVSARIYIEDKNSLLNVLHEFESEFNWNILMLNSCCPDSEEIIKEFPEKLKVSLNEKAPINKKLPRCGWRKEIARLRAQGTTDRDFGRLYFDFRLRKKYLKRRDYIAIEPKMYHPLDELFAGTNDILLKDPNQLWDEEVLSEVLRDYSWKFSWEGFSSQTNVDWNVDLLKSYRYELNWYSLSENPSIKWNESLIDEFKEALAWDRLSLNPSIEWNESLIDKFKGYIRWDSLSKNTSIEWNESLMDKIKDTVHWYSLVMSPAMQKWDAGMFLKYKEYIMINKPSSPIYYSPYINWDVFMLTSLRKILNWESLINNTDIEWTREMIYSNKYYWFKAFNDGSGLPERGLKVHWDLTILSYIEEWNSFMEENGFEWRNYKYHDFKTVSWVDCIAPLITIEDIEKLTKRLDILAQREKEYYEEMRKERETEEEFYRINKDAIDALDEEERELDSLNRDNFDELTDGQYGSYDDWKDSGRDLDDLKDWMGR